MNLKGRLTVYAVIFALAAALAYAFVLRPKILLKNAFGEMATAFEDEDVNRLMEYFSEDFRDESGVVRADVEDFLVFFFESRENIRCEVEKTQFLVRGKTAMVLVWGEIRFETRMGEDIGEKSVSLRDSPLTLTFAREPAGWRVVQVDNGETMLE
jgi:ketosteroid isomerase-like protein